MDSHDVVDKNPIPTTSSETTTPPRGDGGESKEKSELEEVADGLGVNTSRLKRHFFIDDDGLHIENPLNIDPRYALLGFCTIENERKGTTTFENLPMKDKLVTQEGVEIDGWGDFLYNSRRRADIRDDPNSSQSRNKPFRLTRDGREAFIDWLTENNEND